MAEDEGSGPAATSFITPDKTGWLTKRGGKGLRANWRLRWFVLENNYLFYYKTTTDSEPCGIVNLAMFNLCDRAPASILPESEKNRTYYIYADLEDDFTTWMKAIGENIKLSEEGQFNDECSDVASPRTSITAPAGLVIGGEKAPAKPTRPTPPTPKKLSEKSNSLDIDLAKVEAPASPGLQHLQKARPAAAKGRRAPTRKVLRTFDEDEDSDDEAPVEKKESAAAAAPVTPLLPSKGQISEAKVLSPTAASAAKASSPKASSPTAAPSAKELSPTAASAAKVDSKVHPSKGTPPVKSTPPPLPAKSQQFKDEHKPPRPVLPTTISSGSPTSKPALPKVPSARSSLNGDQDVRKSIIADAEKVDLSNVSTADLMEDAIASIGADSLSSSASTSDIRDEIVQAHATAKELLKRTIDSKQNLLANRVESDEGTKSEMAKKLASLDAELAAAKKMREEARILKAEAEADRKAAAEKLLAAEEDHREAEAVKAKAKSILQRAMDAKKELDTRNSKHDISHTDKKAPPARPPPPTAVLADA